MLSAANRIYHAQVDASVRGADLDERRKRYAAFLEADNALVLLGETEDGTPIACFAAIFYAKRAYIEDVFVVHRWRRHGVLSGAIEVLLEHCARRGIERVDVDYLADNPAGAAAWARVGFAPRSISATATVAALRK